MFKNSARYFVLALTLVALTATVRPAYADDICGDPSTSCVVGSGDPPPPPPTGQVVSQKSNDLISYLVVLYGLA